MIMQINGTSSFGFSSSRLSGIDKNKEKTNGIMLSRQQQNEEEDSKAKNLQSQINALREKIQEIDENEEMDAKSKAELKQSFQEQMTALRQQLSQRLAEARQEKLKVEREIRGNDPSGAEETKQSSPKPSDRSKFDTFVRDDALNAAVSADNSVDLAKIHQSAANSKRGRAGILEREAASDTKLVQRIQPDGCVTKLWGKTYGTGENGEDSPGGPVTYEQIEEWDRQGIPHLEAEYSSVIFTEIWEINAGAPVEAKLDEAVKLKNEANELAGEDAKALGDANRVVNGKEEEDVPGGEKTEGFFEEQQNEFAKFSFGEGGEEKVNR